MHTLLDTAALTHDMPAVGLRRGDLGAFVEILDTLAMEVEFVAASGRTQAVTISPHRVQYPCATDGSL